MKKIQLQVIKSCYTLLFVAFSTIAFSQAINTVTINPTQPNDCTPFIINASGTLWAMNIQYLGANFSVSGSTLTVNFLFDDPGITLPAIGSFSENATISGIPAGTYTVVANSYQGVNLHNTMTTTVVITPCCTANAIIAPLATTSFCLGSDAMLISNSVNASAISWSLNGSIVSTDDTLVVSAPAVGVYTYQLEASNGACSKTTNVTITVDYLPPFNLGADTTICHGNAVSLNASSTVGGISYSWSSGQTTSSIAATTTGVYSLTATLGACTRKDTIAVTVNPSPVVNLGNPIVLCAGETATLVANTPNVSFLWSNGSTANSITVDSTGTYTVFVTDSSGCEGEDDIQVTVNPEIIIGLADTATINPSDSIILDAGSWASYSWSTGETTRLIVANVGGVYTVTVTDESGCQSTDSIEITVVSAKSLAALPTLNVFPNPVSNQLRLENSDLLLNNAKVLIINNLGQVEKITMLNNNETIDVSALAKGVYYLQIFNTQNQPIAMARFLKL